MIRDEINMRIFLNYLIYELKTINGKRNSSGYVINRILKHKIKDDHLKGKVQEHQRQQMWKEIEQTVNNSTLTRYKIMKFRSKLSFSAFLRCITIEEMFLIAILKTYQTQVAQGDITYQVEYTEEANKMFNEQIGDELDVRGATKTAPNKTAEELE